WSSDVCSSDLWPCLRSPPPWQLAHRHGEPKRETSMPRVCRPQTRFEDSYVPWLLLVGSKGAMRSIRNEGACPMEMDLTTRRSEGFQKSRTVSKKTLEFNAVGIP